MSLSLRLLVLEVSYSVRCTQPWTRRFHRGWLANGGNMLKRVTLLILMGMSLVPAAVASAQEAAPIPAPVPTQEPTGLGTDSAMDLLANSCFNGSMQACDDLYGRSPADSAYETYGDTCAGRQSADSGQFCVDAFTDTAANPTPTTPEQEMAEESFGQYLGEEYPDAMDIRSGPWCTLSEGLYKATCFTEVDGAVVMAEGYLDFGDGTYDGWLSAEQLNAQIQAVDAFGAWVEDTYGLTLAPPVGDRNDPWCLVNTDGSLPEEILAQGVNYGSVVASALARSDDTMGCAVATTDGQHVFAVAQVDSSGAPAERR